MKFNYFTKSVFLMLFILLALSGCAERRLGSLGPEDEITLIADKSDWVLFKPELQTVFEQEIETPGYEKLFNLNHLIADEFQDHQRRRNFVFISALTSSGATMKLIRQMIREDDLKKVQAGKSFFFKKKDPWAYNQMLVVLIANDEVTLKQKLIEHKDMLFNIFDDRLNKKVKAKMYAKAEQHKLSREMLDKYGCSLRIQHDYRVFTENTEKHFFMLFRDYPKRWFCVSWFDTDDPSLITRDWCIQYRNNIYLDIPGKETVNEEYTREEEVEFIGKRAFRLIGPYSGYLEDGWPKGYGGVFRSYFVFVPEDRRIYMVDYAMFAPDREKKDPLRQLDIMANTFYLRSQLKK